MMRQGSRPVIQVTMYHGASSGTEKSCDIPDCPLPVLVMHWEVMSRPFNREQLCMRDPLIDL